MSTHCEACGQRIRKPVDWEKVRVRALEGMPPYNGTRTSRQAAYDLVSTLKDKRQRVLAMLRAYGSGGATDEQLEKRLGLRHQTVSARRWELVQAGLVGDSGRSEKNTSGVDAILWVARPDDAADEIMELL